MLWTVTVILNYLAYFTANNFTSEKKKKKKKKKSRELTLCLWHGSLRRSIHSSEKGTEVKMADTSSKMKMQSQKHRLWTWGRQSCWAVPNANNIIHRSSHYRFGIRRESTGDDGFGVTFVSLSNRSSWTIPRRTVPSADPIATNRFFRRTQDASDRTIMTYLSTLILTVPCWQSKRKQKSLNTFQRPPYSKKRMKRGTVHFH